MGSGVVIASFNSCWLNLTSWIAFTISHTEKSTGERFRGRFWFYNKFWPLFLLDNVVTQTFEFKQSWSCSALKSGYIVPLKRTLFQISVIEWTETLHRSKLDIVSYICVNFYKNGLNYARAVRVQTLIRYIGCSPWIIFYFTTVVASESII